MRNLPFSSTCWANTLWRGHFQEPTLKDVVIWVILLSPHSQPLGEVPEPPTQSMHVAAGQERSRDGTQAAKPTLIPACKQEPVPSLQQSQASVSLFSLGSRLQNHTTTETSGIRTSSDTTPCPSVAPGKQLPMEQEKLSVVRSEASCRVRGSPVSRKQNCFPLMG